MEASTFGDGVAAETKSFYALCTMNSHRDDMLTNLLPFHELDEHDIGTIGGKAVNLFRMIRAGFPVPMGFVVPVGAYDAFFEHNNLSEAIADILDDTDFTDEGSVRASAERIKSYIGEGMLSTTLEDAVTCALSTEGGALWAVRSSAVAEDLPEASFAGQQDTYLNVRSEDVATRIRQCWASYWNERAIAYRHHAGIPQLANGIAVVVQRMVDSRTSGVMFTRDPLDDTTDTVVIESSWGLGEAIVSGVVSPDRFSCNRNSGKVLSRTITRKTRGVFYVDGVTMERDIPPEDQERPSLTDDEIHALVSLGRRVEEHFGAPQDIEWALEGSIPYLLQSRPITTLPGADTILWTRAYGDEYWADVTSPLFFSLLGEYLTSYVNHEGSAIMGYQEITDKTLLRLHKGHIYFNSEVLEAVFTFNPRFSRTKELLNYFPEKDQKRIANARTKTARRLWAEVRIMALDPDGSILRTDAAYRRWTKEYLSHMGAFDAADLSTFSYEDLHKAFQDMERAYLKHFRLIRYGMVTHSIGTNLMVKRWLVDWLEDRSGEWYARLISGLPDNKTIKTNIALARVAEICKTDGAFCRTLVEESSVRTLAALDDPQHGDVHRAIDDFLSEYGHRSHTREIYYPRWKDDPTLVLDMLRSLVTAPALDYDAMEERTRKERLEAEQEIFRRIARLKGGALKKPLFKTILSFAQTYLIFRENQRFYLDHILARWRRLFLEYGHRFADAGIIGTDDDIFFLSKEEIFALAEDPHVERDAVARRRADFETWASVLPAKFLRGGTEFDDTVVRQDSALRVTGTSASPGIARGQVRVVESIAQLSDVREGEILVTSNTDPGWTPVFAKLAGLVTETGGILSHGAVVSREYGIPAVTAVKGARELFRTGQHATIDGNEGVIYLMEEA